MMSYIQLEHVNFIRAVKITRGVNCDGGDIDLINVRVQYDTLRPNSIIGRQLENHSFSKLPAT